MTDRLTATELAEMEHGNQCGIALTAVQVRGLITEVREARTLLAKIAVAECSMNVETAGLFRFEAPWAFKDDEERLSVAEVIRRHLDGRIVPSRPAAPPLTPEECEALRWLVAEQLELREGARSSARRKIDAALAVLDKLLAAHGGGK